MQAIACAVACMCVSLATAPRAFAADAPPSFRNDVMAVLAKAGCNTGACHGNLHGKGGFKLSLRGQSPQDDFFALTQEYGGRRTDRISPDSSLILLKPTTAAPHQGGHRFDADSLEYRTLRAWIAAGMPNDIAAAPRVTKIEATPRETVLVAPQSEVTIEAAVTFADGSTRNVSRTAVYETTDNNTRVTPDGRVSRAEMAPQRFETTVIVRYLEKQTPVRVAFVPRQDDFTWSKPDANNVIDEAVFARLRTLRINPSAGSSDEAFIRRASLDIIGLPPTADEARAFVADQSPDKRAKLIDRLLGDPAFADFWALKWADLLRIEEKTLDSEGVKVFHGWVRQCIADGKPMDEFARDLITARGSTYKVPPTNFYRAMREPDVRAEGVAQLFLGTRMQCARCHNHPYEKWTQDDYYGFAANFARIDYEIVKNERKDKLDKHQFIGEQIVKMNDKGVVKDPRNDKAAKPRFLGRKDAPRGKEQDELEALAAWMTSPDNDLFVKTMVNRVWFHMMGRGVVEPVDDFRATNPPSNPQLLDALAKHFVASKFNLRELVRMIATSKTYQLASEPNASNADDAVNFSHAAVRRLTAEQMVDSMSRMLNASAKFNGYEDGTRAAQIPGVKAVYRDKEPSSGDTFLQMFGKPDRLLSCECERSNETTLGQVLEFTGGPMINQLITDPNNRLAALLKSDATPAQMIDELYWAGLSRAPSEKELAAATQYIEKTDNKREALEDIAWAIINSKQFMLRH